MKKVILCSIIMNVVLMAHNAGAATVGYWKFDEGAGQTTANENIAERDLTLRTGTSTSTYCDPIWDPQGYSGSSFRYVNGKTGSESGRDFLLGIGANINDLKLATFTIEASIKLNSLPGSAFTTDNPYTILHLKDSAGSYDNYMLRVTYKDASHAKFDVLWYDYAGVLKIFTHSTAIAAGQWYNVAVAHDASSEVNNTSLWVDGVEEVFNTVNHPFADQTAVTFCVGAMTGQYRTRSFDGWIDELRISDTALTTNELLPEPATISMLLLGSIMLKRKRNKI